MRPANASVASLSMVVFESSQSVSIPLLRAALILCLEWRKELPEHPKSPVSSPTTSSGPRMPMTVTPSAPCTCVVSLQAGILLRKAPSSMGQWDLPMPSTSEVALRTFFCAICSNSPCMFISSLVHLSIVPNTCVLLGQDPPSKSCALIQCICEAVAECTIEAVVHLSWGQ